MRERLRAAAGAGLLAVAVGPLLATAWWLLAPRVQISTEDGTFSTPAQATADWFGADGWFLALGAGFGLLVGLAAFLRWRRHPVSALLGMTLGLLAAAVVAWWLGGLLGPDDVADQLAAPTQIDVVVQPLGLRARGVLLVPAIVGVATFAAMAAAAPTAVPDPPPAGSGGALSPAGPAAPAAPR